MEKVLEKVTSCSRCGLCQEVCPVFKVKKTECSHARGKFLQLFGVLREDLKFSRRLLNNLNLCLNCTKCSDACPSSINAVELFAKIRAQKNDPIENFANSRLVFKLKMIILNLLRLFKKQKYIVLPDHALYFKGCIKSSVKVNQKSPFNCCAIPYLVKGKMKTYDKYMKANMRIIENAKADIYFDCATCYDTVLNYPYKDPKIRERLKMLGELASSPTKKMKLTFHKPCHLKDDKIVKTLKGLSNIEFVPTESETCCGFGGDFFFRHPVIAHKLSTRRALEIRKTGADVVLSACPTCIWSLKYGLWRVCRGHQKRVKVLDITTLLP